MTITITAKQRDAVHDQLLDRLSGIGDIELAIESKDYETAQYLGKEYADDLRLLDDLGYGAGGGEAVDLTAPPDVLRRALPRLRDVAERHTASLGAELTEVKKIKDRNQVVSEVCASVLADLDAAEPAETKD